MIRRTLVLAAARRLRLYSLFLPVLILAIAGLAAVSCGGDDATSTPLPAATSTPAGPAATATPTVEAMQDEPTTEAMQDEPTTEAMQDEPTTEAMQDEPTTTGPVPTATARPAPTATPRPTLVQIFPTATPVRAATPTPQPLAQRGGRFIAAVTSQNEEIWRRDKGSGGNAVESAIFAFLVDQEQDWSIVPYVANSWSIDADAAGWEWNLNPAAKFDPAAGAFGGPIDAAALDFTWNMLMGNIPELAPTIHAGGGRFGGLLESTEIIDPTTWRINFTGVAWDFIYENTVWPTQSPMASPNHILAVSEDESSRNPVGSGPYRMIRHDFGNEILMERVPDHWRVGNSQGFEELWVRIIPEATTRLAMLLTGEAHLADLTGDTQKQARDNGLVVPDIGGLTLTLSLGGLWEPSKGAIDTTIPYVGNQADEADPNGTWQQALKVRKALNLAIDRNLINEVFFDGSTEGLSAPLFWPGSVYLPPDMQPYPYDPVEAKRLMVEAGYPNGWPEAFTMQQVRQVGAETGLDIGEYIAQQWEEILDIDVNIVPTDIGDALADYRRDENGDRIGRYAGWVIRFSRFRAEPVANLLLFGSCSSCSLALLGGNAEVERIMDETFNVFDSEARAIKHREIAQWFYDNYWNVPIIVHPIYQAYNPDIVAEYPLIRDASRPLMFERIIPGPGALQ
jgi:ABC-type transport system substrate-binding protein